MIQTILRFSFFAVILTISFAFSATDADAQRAMDKEVRQSIRFARGANSATIRKQICVGYTHLYTLRAEEGQTMTVILTTGNQTSFTIFSPTDGILEGADGETMWRGMLNESGEYLISIGTDATANYKLEVYIK
jgi:hypothetical protein